MKVRYLIAESLLGRVLLNMAARRNGHNKGDFKVLIYHNVACRDFDKFAVQMRYIKSRYGFISPGDLEAILTGPQDYKGQEVLLTFDDGYKSSALLSEKVLAPLGIKAMFFITPGFIDAKNRDEQRSFIARKLYNNLFSEEDVSDEMKPLTWNDLACLLKQGHTIGAHGIKHRRLTDIENENELKKEIIQSGDILQEKLGIAIDHFSYPFGNIESINLRAMKIVRERYKYCYSGIRGNNPFDSNPYAILRHPISPDDPIDYIRFLVEDGLELLYRKRVFLLRAMAQQVM